MEHSAVLLTCIKVPHGFKTLFCDYSIICLKRPLKRKPKIRFLRRIIAKCRPKVLQNAPMKHSAVLLICIKEPYGFKAVVLSIFEWLLKTDVTAYALMCA